MTLFKNFNKQISYDPWVYFFIFAVANALLAYAPLSFLVKILLGLLFVVLPLVVAASSPSPAPEKPFPVSQPSFLPATPLWLSLAALAIFLRLFQLTSLGVWPMWDDAHVAFFSIRQMQNWSFQMFYAAESVPFL